MENRLEAVLEEREALRGEAGLLAADLDAQRRKADGLTTDLLAASAGRVALEKQLNAAHGALSSAKQVRVKSGTRNGGVRVRVRLQEEGSAPTLTFSSPYSLVRPPPHHHHHHTHTPRYLQEIELLKDRLASVTADLSDKGSSVDRLTANVAALKDQLVTLGDHAAQIAKSRTEVLREVGWRARWGRRDVVRFLRS